MKTLATLTLAAGVAAVLSGCGLTSSEQDEAAQCLIVSQYMNHGEQSKLLDKAASRRLAELNAKDCDPNDPQQCRRLYQRVTEAASLRAFPDGDSSNLSTIKKWARASYCKELMSSFRESVVSKVDTAAATPAPDSMAAMTDQGNNVLLQSNSGLEWMRVAYDKNLSWDAAGNFCKEVDFAGGRWRLPKTAELQRIVDLKLSGSPCGAAYACKVSPLFVLPSRLVWSADTPGHFAAELVSLDDGLRSQISTAGSVDEPISTLCTRTSGGGN